MRVEAFTLLTQALKPLDGKAINKDIADKVDGFGADEKFKLAYDRLPNKTVVLRVIGPPRRDGFKQLFDLVIWDGGEMKMDSTTIANLGQNRWLKGAVERYAEQVEALKYLSAHIDVYNAAAHMYNRVLKEMPDMIINRMK